MSRKYLLIAAAALLIACWNSVGFHQGDEHLQLREFAAWKLGRMGQEDLTWEFAERMRPATQPVIVYALHKVWSVFGEVNPYHFAFLLRLLSAGGFLFLAVKIWERYGSMMPTSQLTKWLGLGLLFTGVIALSVLIGNFLMVPLVGALFAWFMSEYFARKRRMSLPSIALACIFAMNATIFVSAMLVDPGAPGRPVRFALANARGDA